MCTPSVQETSHTEIQSHSKHSWSLIFSFVIFIFLLCRLWICVHFFPFAIFFLILYLFFIFFSLLLSICISVQSLCLFTTLLNGFASISALPGCLCNIFGALWFVLRTFELGYVSICGCLTDLASINVCHHHLRWGPLTPSPWACTHDSLKYPLPCRNIFESAHLVLDFGLKGVPHLSPNANTGTLQRPATLSWIEQVYIMDGWIKKIKNRPV